MPPTIDPRTGQPVGSTADALANALAPPTTVDTRTEVGGSTSSTIVKPTPAQEAAIAAHDDAAKAQIAAQDDVQFGTEMAAGADAFNAEAKARRLEQAAAERAAALKVQQERVDAAWREEQQAREVMKQRANVHSYWTPENGGKVSEVVAAFITGLADYAHIRAGGEGQSLASTILDNAIAKNRQDQLDAFRTSKEMHQLAKENANAAQDRLDKFMIQLDHQEAIQREQMAAQIEANAAHMKLPLAQANAAAYKAEQIAKVNEINAKVQGELAKKITSDSGHVTTSHTENDKKGASSDKVTQPEREAAGRLNSMVTAFEDISKNQIAKADVERIQDNKTLMKAAEDGKGFTGAAKELLGKWSGVVPRSEMEGVSEEGKRAWGAYSKARATIQQIITGMAVTEREAKDLESRYMPQPDDSAQTLADKRTGLAKEVRDRMVTAGPLAAPIEKRLSEAEGKTTPAATEPKQDGAKSKSAIMRAITKTQEWLDTNKNAKPEERAAAKERFRELLKELAR